MVIGPSSDANERLVSLEIVRQVLLLRYSMHVRNLVVAALNDTEHPVASMVRNALHTDAGLRDQAQVARLDQLIDQINAMRSVAWDQGQRLAEVNLGELAQAEPEDQRDLMGYLLPGLGMVLPSLATLGMSALAMPFQGRRLAQWFADAKADDAKRIRQVVHASVAAGENPAKAARRVVGTASVLGRDGATQISRNHIDTIVRSGAVHVSAFARDQFYRANALARYVADPNAPRVAVRPVGAADSPAQAAAQAQAQEALAAADRLAGRGRGGTSVFALEQFVAVLDSRTTKLCRGLDGNRYKVGAGPVPPLHMNCRSNRVLVLPDSLGGKLYKPRNYASWYNRQPDAVKRMLAGSTAAKRLTLDELADAAFRDYGARPMTLRQVREEARRIMAFY